MHLPADNALTLPPTNDLTVDDGEPVAATDADVLALLPGWVRGARSPLRDAIVRATRRYWSRVQARVGRTFAANQSPRHAEGLRLDAHGAKRQRPRAGVMEGDAAYRARLLVRPARVTPSALRAAVADLVRPVSPVAPVLFEPATEGLFVQAEAAALTGWCGFVQPENGPLLWAVMPDNPVPAGVWVSAEADVGRPVFVVFLESALYDLSDTAFALPEGYAGTAWSYVGAEVVAATWPWSFAAAEAPPLVEQVLREVEDRRGGGVLWWLYVLPNLGGAL